LPGQAHGSREGLRIEDPHVEAERWSKTAREQLHPLLLVERSGASQERLKTVLVLRDGGGAATIRELGEWSGTQGWIVAQVEQLLEPAPRRGPFVRLDLYVPQLRPIFKVV
jgi:hypothetical protein